MTRPLEPLPVAPAFDPRWAWRVRLATLGPIVMIELPLIASVWQLGREAIVLVGLFSSVVLWPYLVMLWFVRSPTRSDRLSTLVTSAEFTGAVSLAVVIAAGFPLVLFLAPWVAINQSRYLLLLVVPYWALLVILQVGLWKNALRLYDALWTEESARPRLRLPFGLLYFLLVYILVWIGTR